MLLLHLSTSHPCVHALWCYTFKLVAMTQDEYAVINRQ